MTRGPWKYQQAEGHHHVLMGHESLDVNLQDDALAIAQVPQMVKLIKYIAKQKETKENWLILGYAQQILEELEPKKKKGSL